MADNQHTLQQLLEKLDALLQKQDSFAKEIEALRTEIEALRTEIETLKRNLGNKETYQANLSPPIIPLSPVPKIHRSVPAIVDPVVEETNFAQQKPDAKPLVDFNLESFIGENLSNKIGIIIIVLGVGIGLKYAIDHHLISPLLRIILSYLAGLTLVGFAIRFKNKYVEYSAVLLSGAMCILYFTTYAAYSFFHLFSFTVAFSTMCLFTVFTVLASMYYNRTIIALLGLVGAYAVPFLLGFHPNQYTFLFSYIAVINLGILALAISRDWWVLKLVSFAWTWVIFIYWYTVYYFRQDDFGLLWAFLPVFFCTFYATILANILVKPGKFDALNLLLLLLNSIAFFWIGYAACLLHSLGQHLLGLLALVNALIHFIVGYNLYQQNPEEKGNYCFILALGLGFFTLAIPIQFDAPWVSILWALTAGLLFGIGRIKTWTFWEKTAYVLMGLACISMAQDWLYLYNTYSSKSPETRIPLFLNSIFLSSMVFCGSFGFINSLHHHKLYRSPWQHDQDKNELLSFLLATLLILGIYFTFFCEISTYWIQAYKYTYSQHRAPGQTLPIIYSRLDLERLRGVWLINYTLFFVFFLAWFNLQKIKSAALGVVSLGLNIAALLLFLTLGLTLLHQLQDSYLHQAAHSYFYHGPFNLGVRYVSLAFLALLLVSGGLTLRKNELPKDLVLAYELCIYGAVIWWCSDELIQWMSRLHADRAYKLSLSILWGSYALFMVVIGIWRRKAHLRISAIFLFSITLLKLFLYDIAHLNTIPKTIIFIALGILLLIVSYLYIKNKEWIEQDLLK